MSKSKSVFISPSGNMRVLASQEVTMLEDSSFKGIYNTFRKCALAVLNCEYEGDNARDLMKIHEKFDIKLHRKPRGLSIELINAPEQAFVDKKIILGVKENLVSVLRDVLYAANLFDKKSINPTDRVFKTLRNAEIFIPGKLPNLIVCWGGHSISKSEYKYCEEIGYQLGLRGMDICTGCGPGAMKGPMKGAHFGHIKQRYQSRFIGISEPGIIASETPNPIVNQLVIMPDMEKRIEAFIRLSHGIIVFPGGVGTIEEILFLLGILLHEDNQKIELPLIFTGPKETKKYFQAVDNFIKLTLGKKAQKRYEIIIDDPVAVANKMNLSLRDVKINRKKFEDAYYFNSKLTVSEKFQQNFNPSHKSMSELCLSLDMPTSDIAFNLRQAMSGIVSGNIKHDGIEAIEKQGPFQIRGNTVLMNNIDELLSMFIAENRMTMPGKEKYKPCYTIIKGD